MKSFRVNIAVSGNFVLTAKNSIAKVLPKCSYSGKNVGMNSSRKVVELLDQMKEAKTKVFFTDHSLLCDRR